MRIRDAAGFTLTELSIVLAVIGLTVGGILVGSSLISFAKRHAEVQHLSKIEIAYTTFRLKYGALPGDFNDATVIGATHTGNGNGLIDYWLPNNFGEYVTVWEHLSKSGLLEGAYDGTTPVGIACPATTCPGSKLNDQTAFWMGGMTGWSAACYGLSWCTSYSNVGIYSATRSGTLGSIFVHEAYYIDTKLDDGDADRGRMLTGRSHPFTSNCVAGNMSVTDGSADYNLTHTAQDCTIYYMLR
jgi:prepilin-type N-terminal cleavage/methylation domain-containing protein